MILQNIWGRVVGQPTYGDPPDKHFFFIDFLKIGFVSAIT